MSINFAFKKALALMVEQGEFDKIINTKAYSRKERRNALHDKRLVTGILEHVDNDLTKVSFIAVLYDLRSVNVLKDILCLMPNYEGVKTDE